MNTAAAPILAALDVRIAPVRTGALYRLALLAVTLLLVLLPLIYFGLIAAVAWGLWHHATHGMDLLDGARGRGALWGFVIVYLGPLVIGGVLLIFMLKPLLAPRVKEPPPLTLDPRQEPALHAFAKGVADAVGAPTPREIHVDCRVNASASFRRGMLSFLGNDLVLTIGLPLAAGLDTRQLAGVLAHEFGHFAQGAAMRSTFVVFTVLRWFGRMVYERDAWDHRLEQTAAQAGELHITLLIVLQLARLCVWLTRQVLWLLMMVGYGASFWLCRQMEFDADRHAARLGGSDLHAGLARQLTLLSVGEQVAIDRLQTSFREGRLGEDLPALVQGGSHLLPAETRQKLLEELPSAKAGLFDTHPSHRDRIASAERESTAGLFTIAEPARVLFADWDDLCRRATRAHYQHSFSLDLKQIALVPSSEIIPDPAKEAASKDAVRRYFQDLWLPVAPLDPGPILVTAPETGAIQAVRDGAVAAAAACLQGVEAARAVMRAADRADDDAIEAKRWQLQKQLYLVNSRTKPPRADLPDVVQARNERSRQLALLEPAQPVWLARLAALRRVLAHGGLDDALSSRASELESLLTAQAGLAGQQPVLLAMRGELQEMAAVMEALRARPKDEGMMAKALNLLRQLHERCDELRRRWKDVPYPFPSSKPKLTLAGFLTGDGALPHSNDLATAQLAQDLGNGAFVLYNRILASVAEVGTAVEQALGMDPGPLPPDVV